MDIELSFTSKEHIQRLIEGLLSHAWPHNLAALKTPFPEMNYKEAMARYGVDKPDTRFGNLLQDVTGIVQHSDLSRIFPQTKLPDFAAVAIVFAKASVTKLDDFEIPPSSSHFGRVVSFF